MTKANDDLVGDVQQAWPPIDSNSIAPCKKGVPDLYNHMPSRLISQAEAKARGFKYFYDSGACRYGHQAPRFVSNAHSCVDCHRIKAGKPPIGAKAAGGPRQYTQPAAPVAKSVVVEQRAPEPDAAEKRFLEAYAATRDLEQAARAVQLSAAQVEARMAYSAVFKAAVNALEERLGIKLTPAAPSQFEWTDEKRARLIEVWIDTGDIATARDAIHVTPSEYLRELNRNEEFAAEVKLAEPLADQMLEERAYQLALKGNDKLLIKILTAKKPEYRESVKIDLNATSRLDEGQIDARLAQLLRKYRPTAIDAEIVDIEPQNQIAAPDNSDLIG